MPSKAASALAAWAINSNGILQLRTSKGANLEAFFQKSIDGIGERVVEVCILRSTRAAR